MASLSYLDFLMLPWLNRFQQANKLVWIMLIYKGILSLPGVYAVSSIMMGLPVSLRGRLSKLSPKVGKRRLGNWILGVRKRWHISYEQGPILQNLQMVKMFYPAIFFLLNAWFFFNKPLSQLDRIFQNLEPHKIRHSPNIMYVPQKGKSSNGFWCSNIVKKFGRGS